MRTKCDVCGQTKETEYCGFCKANICNTCKHSPKRIAAYLKRHDMSVDKFLSKIKQHYPNKR